VVRIASATARIVLVGGSVEGISEGVVVDDSFFSSFGTRWGRG